MELAVLSPLFFYLKYLFFLILIELFSISTC